ncbi:MAG: carboxypeptidase-like regulatory domain-containing protein, partial [Planctomycetota bacterium]
PPIPLITLEKGDFSAWRAGDPNFAGADMLIRNPDAWCAFWAGHHPEPIPPPPIDFEQHVVIVALQGFQPSGCGPTISIVGLRHDGPFTLVKILDDRRPGPCDIITHPFHIVAVPRAAFPPHATVIFHHQRPFPESGTIAGRVFVVPPDGEEPRPLPGTHIMLFREGIEPFHAMSGWDGSYFFVNVEPGEYVLVAEHPGFEPIEHALFVPPATRVTHDFFMEPQQPEPGAIVGLVLGALPGGEPVPLGDSLVRLLRGDEEVAHFITNEDGFFEFGPIPPGEYVLVATHEGFHPQDFLVMLEPGAVVEHVFVLEPGGPPPPGVFVGQVLGDIDGQCIPLGGALVRLFNPDGEVCRTITNPYGLFVMWDVPPGTYMALAEAEGWLPTDAEVEIFPNQPTFFIFHLQQP